LALKDNEILNECLGTSSFWKPSSTDESLIELLAHFSTKSCVEYLHFATFVISFQFTWLTLVWEIDILSSNLTQLRKREKWP